MEDACRPVLGRQGTGAFLSMQQRRHPLLIADRSPRRNDTARKSSGRRRRSPTEKHAAGGPGMHAVFMHPTPMRSCGTGFFLPRSPGDDHLTQQNNKPAVCSPVLFPVRVAQLLNLNGQVVRPPVPNPKEKKLIENHNPATTITTGDRDNREFRRRCQECFSTTSSLEVLLPEEWSY